MHRIRAYRSRWLLAPAVAISLATQGGILAVYQLTRPIPDPRVTLRLVGDGVGQVIVTRDGDAVPIARCTNVEPTMIELGYVEQATDGAVVDLVAHLVDKVTPSAKSTCTIEVPEGTRIRLSAQRGEASTFGGYQQLPMRTPEPLVTYLGDPLAGCNDPGAGQGDVTQCAFTVRANADLAVEFGEIPQEQQVVMNPEIQGQEPAIKVLPAPIDAEKLDEPPIEVALAPEPEQQPPPVLPPPPPPPQEATPPKPPQPPPPNMVMVEVNDDKNVKEKEPEDATKLSDKNRDVAEETRAENTNLEKETEGKQVASRESDDTTSPEVGGPDQQIRQHEDSAATTQDRVPPTDHSGDSKAAAGAIVGEGADDGNDVKQDQGALAMRDIEGRGGVTEHGKPGKSGRKGQPGINTPLTFQDYERIQGNEKIDEEREVAARKMSSRKGRWERKRDAMQSALENFVPDVRTGNQTALKTRAHPFALYIARMHRRIHELWGFGFLEALDDKGHDHPLNNIDLWVNLEVAVNADGTVHKVTIAKTSGKTEFDVAAIDTVLSAAPYEPTPEAIRSSNGKIYLRWGFYRNWRQCGTFNVEPYILTDVPAEDGEGMLDDGQLVRNSGRLSSKSRDKVGATTVTPDDGRSKDRVTPKTSVTDRQVLFAANLWVSAFTTGAVDKLVKRSTIPFYAGGKVAASSSGELAVMFRGLIGESGSMKDWKLLTPREYGGSLPDGNFVISIRTTKSSFAIVLTRTKSGEYLANQLAR